VPVPNLSHWDKQLGQAQPVPVGQEDWDRLCLSHWDRQAACSKPVPMGQGEVSFGQVIYLRWRPFLVPGQALYPRCSLSQFHLSQLVPQSGSTRPWNFVRKRVKTQYLTLFRATKICVVICRASLLYEMGYPFS